MIASSFISELLDRVDVYDVVNRRVPLKDKGDRGWACCPFHNEKTSSFSVSRTKQFYHCFGCGAHGNAVGFLMNYEGVDYPTAIERLAQEYSMTVRYEGGRRNENKEKAHLTDVMKAAQDFYRMQFNGNAGAEARAYVAGRNLTAETIEKFAIGYSPDGWHVLQQALKNFTPEQLKQVGLTRDGKTGEAYDFFRNRLMFPIRNTRGQTIAFSARTMCGEEPKYINTGETSIFVKGREVFGLYEARQAIHDKKRVIVVEGQMDVIQLSQAGFGEACAPLGTAIKTEHIEKLLKLTDTIIFSFDGDAAGRKAAKRALTLSLPLLQEGQMAQFLFLPDGEDPDSLVQKYGTAAFEEQIAKAIPLSKFLLSMLKEDLDLDTAEGKAKFVADATPLVRSIASEVFKSDIVRQIATACGEDIHFLNKAFGIREVALEKTRLPEPSWRSQRYPYGANQPRPTFSARPTLDPSSPLLSILRNFIYYPQLAVEYESQATEMLAGQDSEVAATILEVISVVTHESEDGFVFAEKLQSVPSEAKGEHFEEMMENHRAVLMGLLANRGLSDGIILDQAQKARMLNTPYESAKIETELVFLQTERQRLDVEIRRIISQGDLDDESRERYRLLSTSKLRAVKEEQRLRAQLSKIITRGI